MTQRYTHDDFQRLGYHLDRRLAELDNPCLDHTDRNIIQQQIRDVQDAVQEHIND